MRRIRSGGQRVSSLMLPNRRALLDERGHALVRVLSGHQFFEIQLLHRGQAARAPAVVAETCRLLADAQRRSAQRAHLADALLTGLIESPGGAGAIDEADARRLDGPNRAVPAGE